LASRSPVRRQAQTTSEVKVTCGGADRDRTGDLV